MCDVLFCLKCSFIVNGHQLAEWCSRRLREQSLPSSVTEAGWRLAGMAGLLPAQKAVTGHETIIISMVTLAVTVFGFPYCFARFHGDHSDFDRRAGGLCCHSLGVVDTAGAGTLVCALPPTFYTPF